MPILTNTSAVRLAKKLLRHYELVRSTHKKYNHAVWYKKYNGCEDTVKYFDSSDDAAREVLGLVSPVSEAFNIEIVGSIYHDRLG
ncbi:hypothetical protein RJP56_01890 [Shewanella baltica]|uniref:hypothetical protein n=1 Tax=Shewanella baltica TaxID=62322 RepID=UPI002871AD05|nr:hypothetical protein [Shewanella baltica]MDR9764807.1 hypothetical protein [Shewanella baltica]